MIKGERVTLRPWRREDLPVLRRWHDDGEVMVWWGERQPFVFDRQFEEHFEKGGRFTTIDQNGYFCICDETDRPIGRLDFEGSARRDRRAEIGIFIGEKDAQNKGYGSEAILLLLNWLFNHQSMNRVWLTVQANNERAIAVYERLGFVREGTLRQHNFYDGQYQDEHVYGFLAHEFNQRYQPAANNWLVRVRPA